MTLPTIMVTTARYQITGCQSTYAGASASTKTRRNAANAAAFTDAAMNAVYGVGAPS